MIEAFGQLKGDAILRIWGRDRGQDSRALRAIADTLPIDKKQNIQWMPEYKNQQIAIDVFSKTDAIVTPSVWVENSPLVIHEAQQSKVPVITANTGGMGEYVVDGVNGLTYEHRNVADLAKKMQQFVDDPELAKKLGAKGYAYSGDGQIPCIDQHINDLESCYKELIA